MKLRSLTPFRERDSSMMPEVGVFGTLHREIDRLFDDFTHGFGRNGPGAFNLAPSMDVTETEKEIEITAELPGLERKDLEISIDDDVLTIRGEKRIEAQPDKQQADKQKNGGKNFHVAERAYGVFYRVIQLPMRVDPSTVKATMSKGVLNITIPKPAQTEAKKIEIKEAA